MGLDNGFIVKKTEDMPWRVKMLCQHEYSDNIEVAYWRKCHQVRAIVLNILGDENDEYVYDVSREQLLDIISELTKNIKRKWYEYDSPFWEWKDYKINHKKNVRNLRRLAKLMKKYPDIVVEFYDSY